MSSENNKRIVLNTGYLYLKMMITMTIALYSTRIVLNALGANDFGIFNLVAGVIAMFSFLSTAMAVSTQRYMSYYLGAKNQDRLSSIFKSSIFLHLLIGILVVFALELAGFLLFNGVLNIAEERIPTAKLVYHFMTVSTFFTINAVPYDAAIIAHENLAADALIGIFDSILRLAIAYILTFYNNDRLVLYAGLMAALIIFMRIVKTIYCHQKFSECRDYRKSAFDVKLVKEMFSFAGWNMFGALCGLGRNQGIAIILNIFFGTVVNAAYGIAYQVNAQLASFSTNMLKALNPQIIKSEGSGERQQMLHLSLVASKYGFFLLAFFAIPLILEMPFVLKLWLKSVPENTIIFCRLILIMSLINQLTIGSYTALQATGRIKMYQPITGSLLLLNIPASWVLLKLGYPPYSTIVSMIVIEILALGCKLFFWISVAGLKLSHFVKGVIIPAFIPTTISLIPIYVLYFKNGVSSTFVSLMLFCAAWATIYIVAIYFLGTQKQEKKFIFSFISNKLTHYSEIK